jgi:hypothetical protein
LIRLRTLFAVCALALLVPAAIAGCGGDDDSSDVDPQTVLDETFNNDTKVSSGNLDLSLSASAGDQGSFDAKLSGPFQGDPEDPNAIPQLDWTGTLSGSGAGTSLSFDGSLIVTEDNAYVEYGGNTYEVGADLFNQFKQAAEQATPQSSNSGGSFSEQFQQGCEESVKAQGGDPSACDIDFESWLSDLSSEGTEDIDGTESDHLSGSVNVEAMLQDLIEIGGSLPQASAAGVPSDAQVQQIADAVSEASFDLYSTTDDHVLDGLDFNLSIDPSQIPQAAASGVSSIDVDFSLRIGSINEDQTVEAPSNAQPIDDLLKQLGVNPSDLGGLGGLGATGGSTGGGGGDTDAYLECLNQASTAAEINQCSSQL